MTTTTVVVTKPDGSVQTTVTSVNAKTKTTTSTTTTKAPVKKPATTPAKPATATPGRTSRDRSPTQPADHTADAR